MPVILRTARDLPDSGAYQKWFAVAGARAAADPLRQFPDLAWRLEETFNGIRDAWWALGKKLGASPTGHLSHAATAAAYNCDLGLMMAWARMAEAVARETETTLIVCDDPWMFRHLADLPGVAAGRAPSLWVPRLRWALRGFLARSRVALRVALSALRLRPGRNLFGVGDSVLLVYGHPQSRTDGFDAYFGTMMAEMPFLRRLLHTDCPAGRAKGLGADGRTASLHAWGNPFFAAALVTTRWRLNRSDEDTEWAWLVRRAAAKENSGGAPAMNRWQMHCQERWLADVKPARVVWPWENHPWERAFCRAAKRHGVVALGYQHTVIGPHQFKFSPATNPDGLDSIPHRIICNGPAYRDQLERWGIPAERLDIGGAFRIARFAAKHFDPDGPVFVALSSNPGITAQMMEAVDKARVDGRRFAVKEHPMYPRDVTESDHVRRTDRTSPEHPGISAVFYGTGTSGLEGLLAGVPTFRLLPSDDIAIDIMPEGVSATPVTVDSLGGALDARPEPPRVRWESIFSDVDPDVWRSHLFPRGLS